MSTRATNSLEIAGYQPVRLRVPLGENALHRQASLGRSLFHSMRTCN